MTDLTQVQSSRDAFVQASAALGDAVRQLQAADNARRQAVVDIQRLQQEQLEALSAHVQTVQTYNTEQAALELAAAAEVLP